MSGSPTLQTIKKARKLRIFLSYSSAQLTLAAQVEMALTTSGHDVFFDRTDLAPGDEFHKAIHERIRTSDLFVFLISPESISKGRYARTELQFAQDAWPNPIGRILPVLAVETDFSKIPEYLKGGTILRPEGNLAAEVTAAVNDFAAGIKPNETFAEHIKLARQLRRQQNIAAIENDWLEEKRRLTSGGHRGTDTLSVLGAKAGALIFGFFAFIFGLFSFEGIWGGGWVSGIFPSLVFGGVVAFVVYHRASEYESAEAAYLSRLDEAAADESADDKPMFSEFMK